MRRLSLQLLALLMMSGAVRIVTTADTFSTYLLRDALLVALPAAVLFAWQSGSWRPVAALRRVTRLSSVGQLLWLTGLVCLLTGGVGAGFSPLDPGSGFANLAANLVWGLGFVLSVAGAWWPGAAIDYTPPAYRWERDARGQFVRTPIGGVQAEPLSPTSKRGAWGWALAVVMLGVVLRFWNLAELPAGCVGGECIDGLRLVDGQMLTFSQPGAFNFYERLAHLLLNFTGDGVLSLRLAGAGLGSLTLVIFAGVARRLTPPIFVAPALLLLAVNPWHIWASRVSDGWLVPALLVTLALWLVLEALAHGDVRWWTMAGLALGLLWVEAPSLRVAVLLWSGVILGGGLWIGGAWRSRMAAMGGALAALVGVAAPMFLAGMLSGAQAGDSGVGAQWAQAATVAGALLRPDVTLDGALAGSGLLSALVAALTLLGLGVLVRSVRQHAALVIGAGLLLAVAASLTADLTVTAPRSLLLPSLPLLLTTALLALDRLLTMLVQAWGRLVRPAQLAAATGLLLLAILGIGAARFAGALNAMQGAGQGSLPNEIARFVADQLAAAPQAMTGALQTYVVPAGVLNHPSMRLLAGAAIEQGRVQRLDLATTMPYAATPPGDVIYLVPVEQSQVLDQLRQMYPDAAMANGAPDNAWTLEGRRALFSVLTASRQTILDSQALHLLAYRGSEARPGAADLDGVAPAFPLGWQSFPPLSPPFYAELTSSLSIPEAGMVMFSTDIAAGSLMMKLDDLLVLDTQLGLTQQTLALAQGIYRLTVTYHSGSQPADVTIFWQPSGATAPTPLPSTALHLPVLTDAGLLGDYREGGDANGMMLTQRKDRVIGFDFGLAQPFNVHWQGKIGVTRAGEYLLATLSDGPNQMSVDGMLVIDGRTGVESDPAADNAYHEGLIYLAPGWHEIELRYTPQSDAPEFRLLWQPPGASPSALTGAFLLPTTGEVSLADKTPPPAPPLLDPALGDDAFALTRAASIWQPDVRIPPTNLEPLPLETLWTAGAGCGAGENQLNAPHGVAFDPARGQLYVADAGNRRVQMLDLDGGFRGQIAAPVFEEPVDVAFAPDGALLVLDAVAGPLYRIGADGAPVALPIQTTFYRPRGFDVGDEGVVAVADTGGGRVVTLTAEGVVQSQFGGIDTLLARGQPVDTLLGASGLWAVSAEDGRLSNLSIDGGLTAVQPTNTIDGPQLAALPTGGLVVSDPLRRTFTTFAPSGKPLQQFVYTEQLDTPTGIATLALGDQLFIAASDTRACTVSLWRMAVSQLR